MACTYLIGINHYDPLGPAKVKQALRLAKEKGFIPDCIATEWGYENAQAVMCQRKRFGELLSERLPQISSTDIDELKLSLAYEVDAHIDIYPDIPVIWLDEGRISEPSVIEKYADDRAAIILSAAKNTPFSLEKLSYELIRKSGYSVSAPSGRDDKFTTVISDAVMNGYQNIACVIGSNHADLELKGMFGQQLVQKGYMVMRYNTTTNPPTWG